MSLPLFVYHSHLFSEYRVNTFTVTREANQLFIQATGQPKFEVFPESDKDYFLKVVDAQITFETDAQGKATGLVLHQGGDKPAKRIE